jgi:hypothetical protein
MARNLRLIFIRRSLKISKLVVESAKMAIRSVTIRAERTDEAIFSEFAWRTQINWRASDARRK